MKMHALLKVALVPVLVWCGFAVTTRLSRHATLRRGDELRRAALEADAKLKYSDGLSLANIRGAVDGLVAATLATNQASLDAEQTAALRAKLVTCIASHSVGTVDDYVMLIAPSSDTFEGWADASYSGVLRQVVTDLLGNPDVARESAAILGGRDAQGIKDMRELARIKRMLFASASRSWTNPIFCNKCWSTVALKDMTLRLSTTPYPPTSIFEQAKSEGHHGYKNFKPNKTVRPTLLETLGTHGAISAAMFSFVVKTEEPVERHRIYASFYYSPENGDWILEDFGCGDPTTKFHYEIY